MSRVGKNPVKLPPKVEAKLVGDKIEVKGPLGTLHSPIFPGIEMEVQGDLVTFKRNIDDKQTSALHGLVRALFNNNVKGVSSGWEKNLEIFGVGYRAQKKGSSLVMNLGYSHDVTYPEPAGIKIDVTDQLKIKISGIDRQLVGQVAANIRSLKMPEPYKGKGIKYANENIRRKAGKTGKK
ncbi:MAG: 50S ribosomal protein L6 [Leptospiraceae bacterium]|nr:50S ribosomal protein L6 [Leptospiraceae bacterium]MCP5511875.1 50S ribosomal protein L6 [Leptospiraceae bacterium]